MPGRRCGELVLAGCAQTSGGAFADSLRFQKHCAVALALTEAEKRAAQAVRGEGDGLRLESLLYLKSLPQDRDRFLEEW